VRLLEQHLPLSFALTAPVAGLFGVRATLIGAGLIGGAITLAALFLRGMRDIEGESSQQPALTPSRA
jgi:hypothetical protein